MNKPLKINLYNLVIVILIIVTIVVYNIPDTFFKEIKQNAITQIETKTILIEIGNIEVHFSKVEDVENIISAYILNSSFAYCAFFDLDSEKIMNSLITNKKYNEISVIIDYRNSKYFEEFIKQNNINVNNINVKLTLANSSGLMHNKFCILENNITITGSLNPTFNGFNKNDNNLAVIQSETIWQNYYSEFKELELGKFHTGTKTIQPKIKLIYSKNDSKKILVENYFCPEDSCSKKVIQTLSNANNSVYFMTYSFTDDDIGDLLIELNSKKIEIKGIFEKVQNSKYSEYSKLISANISSIILDKNPAMMHHKVFIIDNSTTIFGSYNPTANADKNNDENILIVHDKIVAKEFLNEFERLYELYK